MKVKITYKKCMMYLVIFIMYSTLLYFSVPLRFLYYVLVPLLTVILLLKYGMGALKNPFSCLIIVSEIWILVSTTLNGNITKENIFRLCSIISLVVLFSEIKDVNVIINSLKNVFLCISIIDMISVLYSIFIKNIQTSSIGWLGHKNYHVIMYIMAIGFLDYCQYKKRGRRNYSYYIFVCISLGMMVVLESATSMVAFAIYLFITHFLKNKKVAWLNLYNVLFLDIVVFYFVVYKQYIGKIFGYLLGMLGRDLGFTGRSVMWSAAILDIEKMPFYGYGENFQVFFKNMWSQTLTNHVHNYLLHVIVSGGWIYVIVMVIIYLYAARCLKKTEDRYLSRILLSFVIAYLIIGQAEIIVNINNMLLPLLFLTSKITYEKT